MVEAMARCDDRAIRDGAIAALGHCAAGRAFGSDLPALLATPSPAERRHRLVYDACGKDRLPGTLVRTEGEPEVADTAVDEAYEHAGDTCDFFHAVCGRNSLNDRGMALISSVHVGEPAGRDRFQPMSNAFWNGSQMADGEGDGTLFRSFTRALDVAAHELTHGVQAFTSNLVSLRQSEAIHEHFADVFGVLVRQWRRRETAVEASWLVGADVLVSAETRQVIRDLEHPGTASADHPLLGSEPQPGHMKRLCEGPAGAGGVHLNSGIPNRAFVIAAR